MTRTEAVTKAEEFKRNKDSPSIVELLLPFWADKKTVDVACLLAYAYRRLKEYTNCRNICDEADRAINNPTRIKTQRKWCYLFEEILDEGDENLSEIKARSFLKTLSEVGYDFAIIKFMCQVMATKYEERSLDKAISWLLLIDGRKLDNKVRHVSIDSDSSIYEEEKLKLSSEKYIYYAKLAKLVLSHSHFDVAVKLFLESYSPVAQSNMISVLAKRFKNNQTKIRAFSKILMLLKEEKFFMDHAVSNSSNGLTISDISHYVYCPISFIISKSVLKQDCSLNYDEEITFTRKFISDYYEIYQHGNKNIDNLFRETFTDSFSLSSNDMKILQFIFSAVRFGQNVRTPNQYMSSVFKGADISGSPDLALKQDVTFCVEEVFTSKSVAQISTPFENDQMKLVGYVYEFGFEYGYLCYWNTYPSYNSLKKTFTSSISGLKIFKIEKSGLVISKYLHYKNEVKMILGSKTQVVKPINYNKCISCGVFESCVHKRGYLKNVKFPYKENYS